jgi:HEAT repeat protein
MFFGRTILPVLLSAAAVAGASSVNLPSIETPLPFGINVIPLPPPARVNLTSSRTVDLLATELRKPETTPDRKAELIADLARTQLQSAATPLIDAAGDPDPAIRACVAQALASLADPSESDAVKRLSTDNDPEVRAEADRAAGALHLEELVSAGIHDPDTDVVCASLSVAGAPQSAEIVTRLTAPDIDIRIAAINAVARADLTANADAVAALLRKDLATRIAAVRALAVIGAASHAHDILKLLSDPHPTVRREATIALVSVLSTADAQSYAIEMLADGDLTVRTSAALDLAKVPGPDAVSLLVKQLSDPYVPLHDAARSALLAAGGAAIPAAENLLDDPNPRRREDASWLLGTLRSSAGFHRHLALLDDPDWSVVAQAAKSLGEIGNPSAASKLQQTFERARALISGTELPTTPAAIAATNAIVSAVQLGYTPITPEVSPLILKRGDYPSNVRAAAVWAVGILGAPDESTVFRQLHNLIEDPFEAGDVKIESVKAVGNRKSPDGKSVFGSAAAVTSSDEQLAIVHWSQDRLNGAVTPFSLPPEKFIADTSITDQSAN